MPLFIHRVWERGSGERQRRGAAERGRREQPACADAPRLAWNPSGQELPPDFVQHKVPVTAERLTVDSASGQCDGLGIYLSRRHSLRHPVRS